MIRISKNRQQGATIVFVLMALIALLAVAVVFLSRLAQKDESPSSTAPEPPIEMPAQTEADTSLTAPVTTATTELIVETPAPEPDAAASPNIVIPPPPPPLLQVTPDPKSLPPEG